MLYRNAVGILLINDDRKIFAGLRKDVKVWQMPQGGKYMKETEKRAMYRELKEEVGLCHNHVEILGVS